MQVLIKIEASHQKGIKDALREIRSHISQLEGNDLDDGYYYKATIKNVISLFKSKSNKNYWG